MMRAPAPQPVPLVDRRFPAPAYDVEFHLAGCECHHCAPATEVDDRLTFTMLGNLALLGAIVGTLIAFAINPAGAWAALADIVRSFG